jgi:UDP-N-acetylmuramate dehydrogenase
MQENVKLAPYTTFRIGGESRYFFVVKNITELKSAIIFAKQKELPTFILGGGSNVLISDDGFRGVVIKIEFEGVTFEEKLEKIIVSAGAGVVWDDFVELLVSKNINGLENLSFIPGVVGASPVQNIGAYGDEVGNSIQSVEVFNSETLTVEHLTKAECDFSYRDSIFKKTEGRSLVVTKVTFSLSNNFKPNLSYKELENYFFGKNKSIDAKLLREAVINIRTEKLPNIKDFGTAGSFFKNPIISSNSKDYLVDLYPKLPYWDCGGGNYKVSAAYIIDKICNAKSFSFKDACVWPKQALVIFNKGSASSKDVLNLAEKIEGKVFEKTGINLEREVQYIF